VLIKYSLPYVDGSSTKLCYWQNIGAGVILGVVTVLKGEATDFANMARSGTWDWSTFAWGNLVTGVFGFLISVAGILSVKVTSPVTHMFSSAARSVLQVILGVRIFGDILTTQRAMSILTILSGTLLYSWLKSRETPLALGSKNPILPMANVPGTGSASNLLVPRDRQSISASERIFTGAYESNKEASSHPWKPLS